MSDEELLQIAEKYLNEIKGKVTRDPDTREIANSLTQASIAASLLAIARNSVERPPVLTDPALADLRDDVLGKMSAN